MGYIWKGSPKNGYWTDNQNGTQNDTQNNNEVSRIEKVKQVVCANSMTTKEALAKMLNVTNASRFLRAEPLGEGVAEDPAEQSVTGSFPSTSSGQAQFHASG